MIEPLVHRPDDGAEPQKATPTPARGVKARILLADDSPAARVLTSALIRRLGFEVDTVANGEEALERAHAEPYDMIILDIDMPVIDGLSTARDLRTIRELGGKTVIVAMSGYLSEFSGADDWDELFDATITKPVSRHQLLDAILGLLPTDPAINRPNVAEERFRDCPILNKNLIDMKRHKTTAAEWSALVAETTRQLREIAADMDRAIAGGDTAFLSQVKTRIVSLPLMSAATQLSRRASLFEVAATTLPANALADQAQRLVGCILTTVVHLRKHLEGAGGHDEAEGE